MSDRAAPHVWDAPVRVRYADTDQMGIAYYANYLAWFEVGRAEWFRSIGHNYRDLEAQGFMLPVIEAHCEYRQSARYDDALAIRTRGRLVSAVRVRFEYEVILAATGQTAAVGYTVHAATDIGGRPKRLPPLVRTLFS